MNLRRHQVSEDEADVWRVRDGLRRLGIIESLSWKPDQATRDGLYQVRGHKRVSRYWWRPGATDPTMLESGLIPPRGADSGTLNRENFMITAEIHGMVEAPWLDAPIMRVGGVPPYLPTPDAYVIVAEEDEPLLRIDVYKDGYSCFQEVIIWEGWVVIGFGEYAHLVRPEGGDTRSVNLGFYFGHLYPMEGRLLVASGDKLFCLTPDGGIAWVSKDVGLDGVIVDHVEDDVMYGRGEWDPPGGWEPFQVSLTTGAVIKGLWAQ